MLHGPGLYQEKIREGAIEEICVPLEDPYLRLKPEAVWKA
jgi:hypothetical protein